ncbi:aspartic peptidase domain-containing protein [Apiosordaria backusii]|uniref:Aspartic peptidase domain-containing protein n=1 Tax=Apiosordaria backusii TaxID=314023 RepID=A0AA40BNA6_9PEZI|nr:aspartic peptidase domain-containing protein [Apiosordaria backusii]
MPSSKLLSLLALLPAAALATDNAAVQPSGLVRHSLTAQEGGSLFSRHSKRQLATASSTKRAGTLYTISVKFGTPGQSVPVQIDTTQSELFANPVCSKSSNPSFCSSQPRFTMSSSLVDLGVQGHLSLRDGGYADFTYVSDYIGIESARITQQIFGVAYDTSGPTNSILGLGPSLEGWTSSYPSLLDNLKSQGHIGSRVWSLDVKGFESQSGSVIFGGIDTSKYTGDLAKIPIVPAAQSPDGWTRYWIRLDGLSVVHNDGHDTVDDVWTKPDGGVGQAFLIDSGASLTALPSSIYNRFITAFSGATPNSDGTLTIQCPTGGETETIDFTFNGKVISVPFNDFVVRVPDSNTCLLGVYEDSFPVLGANFLRAAYVVFDHDNRNIHLAQSDDCGASSLVAVGTGADAVPSVAGCAPPATSTTTAESSTTTEEATTTTEEVATTTEEAATTTEDATTTTEEATTTTEEAITTTEDIAATTTEEASETATESATETESDDECPIETGTESVTETTTDSATQTATESVTETSVAEPSITATETSAIETTAVETTSFPVTTTAPPLLTITYTETSTSTITSCPPTVPKCPVGSVTIVTQVITATTSVCPQTTATYTFPAAGPSQPPVVVTLTPVEPLPAPVTVPGCSCTAPPFPSGTGSVPTQPTTLATLPHVPGTGVPHVPGTSVPHVPGTGVPHVPGTSVPHVPGTSPVATHPTTLATLPHLPGTGVPHLPGTGAPPAATHPGHGGHNGTAVVPTVVPTQPTDPVTAGSAKISGMMSWGVAAVVGGVLAAML